VSKQRPAPSDPNPEDPIALGCISVVLLVPLACCAGIFVFTFSINWKLAAAARKNGIDPVDLVLRCYDEHDRNPLYLLKLKDVPAERSRKVLNTPLADPPPPRRGPQAPGPAAAPAPRPRFPSPAYALTAEMFEEARQGVRFFADDQGLASWGNTIYDVGGFRDDDQLWAAWQGLIANSPHAARDLPRLRELVREAYPVERDYQAAMAWAKTYYARVGRYSWLRGASSQTRQPGESDNCFGLPPWGEPVCWWLLYQFVGLTEDSREFAQRRWLAYFPRGRRDALLAWGRELDAERRAGGEPLPPASDGVSLLCVIERFTGSDAYGEKCRVVLASLYPADKIGGIGIFYPHEDLWYLIAAGDPLSLHPHGDIIALFLLVGGFGYLLLPAVVFYVCLVTALWLWKDPRFRRYLGRSFPGTRRALLGYGAVLLTACLFAWLTLPARTAVLLGSPLQVAAGLVLAALFGTTLIGLVTRTFALLLIRVGVDVEEVWYDEIFGLLVSAVALWHFGCGPLAIVALAAFELVPMLAGRPRKDATAAA
jgi:hypothetical protein